MKKQFKCSKKVNTLICTANTKQLQNVSIKKKKFKLQNVIMKNDYGIYGAPFLISI